MTVRVNKSSFNIREKLSELERPIGLKGSELMRAETAQEARDLVSAGRKNLLINGRMQVWQRATSHTTASGYRSVDRWSFNTYTSGAFTVSKGTDTVHGEYLSWNRTTADTNNPAAGNCLQQAIEDCAYLVKGKYITLSFWLKNEKTILRSGFARLRLNASPYTALGGQQTWTSTTNEWEYHTITWQIPESIATTHLELQIQLDNGSSMGDIKITKVQLEVGKNATEFEHRSYGEELALCQRYFQKIGNINFHTWSHDIADTTGMRLSPWSWPGGPMRVSPTLSFDDGNGNSNRFNVRDPDEANGSTNVSYSITKTEYGILTGFKYPYAVSGFTRGQSGYAAVSNLTLSAEL